MGAAAPDFGNKFQYKISDPAPAGPTAATASAAAEPAWHRRQRAKRAEARTLLRRLATAWHSTTRRRGQELRA